jgi:hypothetical protein
LGRLIGNVRLALLAFPVSVPALCSTCISAGGWGREQREGESEEKLIACWIGNMFGFFFFFVAHIYIFDKP